DGRFREWNRVAQRKDEQRKEERADASRSKRGDASPQRDEQRPRREDRQSGAGEEEGQVPEQAAGGIRARLADEARDSADAVRDDHLQERSELAAAPASGRDPDVEEMEREERGRRAREEERPPETPAPQVAQRDPEGDREGGPREEGGGEERGEGRA